MTDATSTLKTMRIEMDILIEAQPDKVWDAIVHHTSDWWGAPYQMSPNLKAFKLEPQVGGRLYEDWGSGNGTIWGFVSCIERPRALKLRGAFGMGNAQCVLSFTLEPKGQATLVKFSHRGFGELDEQAHQAFTYGWTDLLQTRLKELVETGKKYGLGHEPPHLPPGMHK